MIQSTISSRSRNCVSCSWLAATTALASSEALGMGGSTSLEASVSGSDVELPVDDDDADPLD